MTDRASSKTDQPRASDAVRLFAFFYGFNTDNIALVTKETSDGMPLTIDALFNIKVSLTSVVVR
jgi:hypothetical protein